MFNIIQESREVKKSSGSDRKHSCLMLFGFLSSLPILKRN